MRTREEISKDGKVKADLMIEVLLDVRDLLVKLVKAKPVKKKIGRPKKVK